MKYKLLVFICFGFQIGHCQFKNNIDDDSSYTYIKLEFSTPLRANQSGGEINQYSGEKEPIFLPDGLSGRIGYGTHLDKWLALGINTGIDWKGSECSVLVPIYGTLKISPLIGKTRFFIEPGLGKTLSLGNQKFSGYFKKLSLGLENVLEGFGIYAELCEYGLSEKSNTKIGSLSLGINYIIF